MCHLLGFFLFVFILTWPVFEITAPWRKGRSS